MNSFDMQSGSDPPDAMPPESDAPETLDADSATRRRLLQKAASCLERRPSVSAEVMEAVCEEIRDYCVACPEEAEMDALEDHLLLLEKRIAAIADATTPPQ